MAWRRRALLGTPARAMHQQQRPRLQRAQGPRTVVLLGAASSPRRTKRRRRVIILSTREICANPRHWMASSARRCSIIAGRQHMLAVGALLHRAVDDPHRLQDGSQHRPNGCVHRFHGFRGLGSFSSARKRTPAGTCTRRPNCRRCASMHSRRTYTLLVTQNITAALLAFAYDARSQSALLCGARAPPWQPGTAA
jgi:hypothetical protein